MNYTSVYMNDLTKIQEIIPDLHLIYGKRVLITGATGLICSAIVDFLVNQNDSLNADITVFIAARNHEKAEERFGKLMNRSDVVFVEYEALKDISWDFDVDYIIHGASPANPALYLMQPVETMLANVLGISNILSYAKDHKTKRVLFISSSEVYGKKENNTPYGCSEYGYLDILNPRACYPSAKRACETLCASYYAEYGVDSVIVRPGHIYGPTATRNDTRASTQFFFDVLDGHDIVMKSAGSQIRSYCYVIDCVSAILTALLKGKTGKAYNISNPSSVVTIRDLAEKVAKRAGYRVVFEKATDKEKNGYNLMDNSSLDSTELQELGWEGLFSIEDGIDHTYRNYKDNTSIYNNGIGEKQVKG